MQVEIDLVDVSAAYEHICNIEGANRSIVPVVDEEVRLDFIF